MQQPSPATPQKRLGLRLGVRQKLVLILAVTLMVSLTISGWLALKFQQEDLLAEAQRRGDEVSLLIAKALPYSVVGYDYHTLELLLEELVDQEDIVFARVLSAKGNVMAAVGRQGASDGKHVMVFNEDIHLNGETIGQLVLGFSNERLVANFQKHKISVIQQELLVILVITLVEFLALSYIIIRPVTLMSRAIGEGVSADGQIAHAIPIRSNDEFGQVARKFNRLRSDLIDANAQLQSKVNLADEELKRANALLRDQSEELKRINAELERLAITDPLTGLYNRRYFEQLMEHELALSVRNNDVNSIILADIDSFKQFNDRYGHDVGDAIIKEVAQVLCGKVRKTDLVCRFGGDEFFVLCKRADGTHALRVAETLCDSVARKPITVDNLSIMVTISAGVATMPCEVPIKSAADFLKLADIALYRSKQQGRNMATLFSRLREDEQRTL